MSCFKDSLAAVIELVLSFEKEVRYGEYIVRCIQELSSKYCDVFDIWR